MITLDSQGFIEAAGGPLEYRWIGPRRDHGPTLVFLHEGLGCVAMWRDFPDRVAAQTGLGVFVYSRHGYAGSAPTRLPRPIQYLTPEGQEVLPGVLTRAGIERTILIGHSDGASIALIYAGRRHCPALEGLILLAPHVFCEDLSVENIAAAKQAFEQGDLRSRLMKYHGDRVDDVFWGWNQVWLDPRFMDWNIESCLPRVKVPVLILQGGDDQYGTIAQIESIEQNIPGPVDRVILPDCRHNPHVDQTDRTLAAMVRFIASAIPENAL